MDARFPVLAFPDVPCLRRCPGWKENKLLTLLAVDMAEGGGCSLVRGSTPSRLTCAASHGRSSEGEAALAGASAHIYRSDRSPSVFENPIGNCRARDFPAEKFEVWKHRNARCTVNFATSVLGMCN